VKLATGPAIVIAAGWSKANMANTAPLNSDSRIVHAPREEKGETNKKDPAEAPTGHRSGYQDYQNQIPDSSRMWVLDPPKEIKFEPQRNKKAPELNPGAWDIHLNYCKRPTSRP
jgi:hypothetical protein